MAGGGAVDAGPAVRLYRAEWSTNCERVGLALAHKGIAAQSVLIEYTNRAPVEAISGQRLVSTSTSRSTIPTRT